MPENAKKTAASATAGASLPDDKPAGSSNRDRSKSRMSEGVRADLEQKGEAVDPVSGDLYTREANGEVRHVPAAQIADYRHKHAQQLVHGDNVPDPNTPKP